MLFIYYVDDVADALLLFTLHFTVILITEKRGNFMNVNQAYFHKNESTTQVQLKKKTYLTIGFLVFKSLRVLISTGPGATAKEAIFLLDLVELLGLIIF